MPNTENQRQANKRWREAHKEEYNKKQRVYAFNYWEANKEKCLAQKKSHYQFKKEFLRLANICLE